MHYSDSVGKHKRVGGNECVCGRRCVGVWFASGTNSHPKSQVMTEEGKNPYWFTRHLLLVLGLTAT